MNGKRAYAYIDSDDVSPKFPCLPSSLTDKIFSLSNIRRLMKNNKTPTLVFISAMQPHDEKRPPEKSIDDFEAMLNRKFAGNDGKMTYVKENAQELYQLYERVRDVGGYWEALGNGLWEYMEEQVVTAAKDIYEDYLISFDSKLHSEDTAFSLPKLKKTFTIPSFPFPSSPKSFRYVYSLPSFIFRFIPSISDLQDWCASSLHIYPVSPPCDFSLSSDHIFTKDVQIPLLCLNTGTSLCVSEVEFEDGKLKWMQGLVPSAVRLMSMLETPVYKQLKYVLPSLIFDMLQQFPDTCSLISLRNQYLLAERLLNDLCDGPGNELPSTEVNTCSTCHKVLFCVGQQCSCKTVACRRCHSLPHSCPHPNWSWVRTPGYRDLPTVRSTLTNLQKRFLQSLQKRS